MGNWFHDELDALNTHLLEMGSMIEYAIETGVQAMEQRNAELARTIVSYDREIDQKEREIESQCLKLLLRQHPVARDLRFISARCRKRFRKCPPPGRPRAPYPSPFSAPQR